VRFDCADFACTDGASSETVDLRQNSQPFTPLSAGRPEALRSRGRQLLIVSPEADSHVFYSSSGFLMSGLGRTRTTSPHMWMPGFQFGTPSSERLLPAPSSNSKVRVLSLANGAHRRTEMGISHDDPGALGRPAWNACKQVGIKKPLKQRQIWQSPSSWTVKEGFEIGRFSILPSTASSAAAIW
jgi:hypothetical protein